VKLKEAMILACKKHGDTAMVAILEKPTKFVEGYASPYYATKLKRNIKRD